VESGNGNGVGDSVVIEVEGGGGNEAGGRGRTDFMGDVGAEER